MNISTLQDLALQRPIERKIFRAYDIRGDLKLLSPNLIRHIGWSLATMLRYNKQQQVVVGYDARLTSPEYAKIIAKSLASLGLEVKFIGCVSSPVLYFTASLYGGNGVMITASHNAVTDNGVKWLMKGLPPTPQEIQTIADYIDTQRYAQMWQGNIEDIDPLSAYFSYIKQDIHLANPIKISLEGLHGSAGAIAQQALTELGCAVDGLHCQADGNFPLGAPDPSDVERLAALKQSVLSHQSVMGIALDGDGDRLVVLDEQGNLVSPDRLMSLFAKICLQQDKGKYVICDVKCSSLIAQTAQKYGGHLKMIRTGSSFLRNHLANSEGQAIFGGEFAGHYVFNDGRGKGYDDGLYAALRVLEYLDQQQISLSQALAEFPDRIATHDIYIDCQDANYQHIAQLIQQHAPTEAEIIQVDGLRLDFPFGFGIIRPSNTGEYFTVRFDADDHTQFAYIRQLFVDALSPYYPTIAQRMAVNH